MPGFPFGLGYAIAFTIDFPSRYCALNGALHPESTASMIGNIFFLYLSTIGFNCDMLIKYKPFLSTQLRKQYAKCLSHSLLWRAFGLVALNFLFSNYSFHIFSHNRTFF